MNGARSLWTAELIHGYPNYVTHNVEINLLQLHL